MNILIQIFITLTAPTAVWLLGHNYRRTACIIGLLSQLGFLTLFVYNKQFVMLLPTFFYTIVWISNWRKIKC